MFDIVSPMGQPMLKWYTGAACYRGQLLFEDTGAKPVAAESTAITLLGICAADAGSGAAVDIYPARGVILKIPYYASASDQTLSDADLGKAYDINVTANDMTLDTDDTSGFCHLIGYNNDEKFALVMLPTVDFLVG